MIFEIYIGERQWVAEVPDAQGVALSVRVASRREAMPLALRGAIRCSNWRRVMALAY